MKEKEIGKIEALDRVIKLCYECIEVIDNKNKIDSYYNVITFCECYKKIIEGLSND